MEILLSVSFCYFRWDTTPAAAGHRYRGREKQQHTIKRRNQKRRNKWERKNEGHPVAQVKVNHKINSYMSINSFHFLWCSSYPDGCTFLSHLKKGEYIKGEKFGVSMVALTSACDYLHVMHIHKGASNIDQLMYLLSLSSHATHKAENLWKFSRSCPPE